MSPVLRTVLLLISYLQQYSVVVLLMAFIDDLTLILVEININFMYLCVHGCDDIT